MSGARRKWYGRRLVADLETPVSAFLKIAGGRPMSFLLESVEGGAVRGRYSIIGLEPDLIWRADGDRGRDQPHARAASPTPSRPARSRRSTALRALIAESRIALPDGLPPMAAGVFGYLGYDMVRLMEELPTANPDPIGIPDARADPPDPRRRVRCGEGHDHRGDAGAAASRRDARRPHSPAPANGCRRVVDALDRPLDKSARELRCRSARGRRRRRTPRRPNIATMVRAAKEYIAAGDIFQVVLSQRFEAPFALPPFALYRALRRVNPSPFLYFLDFGGFAVVGSSPEILVRVRDGRVTIRPIAGTRPRGATPHEDKALEAELLADPKERAEHLMLLDLGRNDVGRVARDRHASSVTDQFFVERYSQVMHIVSNVEGELADGTRRARCAGRRAFRPAPSPARRRCARWRSSTNWRRKSAASMPAASAISRPRARWTPASCCAPRW